MCGNKHSLYTGAALYSLQGHHVDIVSWKGATTPEVADRCGLPCGEPRPRLGQPSTASASRLDSGSPRWAALAGQEVAFLALCSLPSVQESSGCRKQLGVCASFSFVQVPSRWVWVWPLPSTTPMASSGDSVAQTEQLLSSSGAYSGISGEFSLCPHTGHGHSFVSYTPDTPSCHAWFHQSTPVSTAPFRLRAL